PAADLRRWLVNTAARMTRQFGTQIGVATPAAPAAPVLRVEGPHQQEWFHSVTAGQTVARPGSSTDGPDVNETGFDSLGELDAYRPPAVPRAMDAVNAARQAHLAAIIRYRSVFPTPTDPATIPGTETPHTHQQMR